MIQDTLSKLIADAVSAASRDLGFDPTDLPRPELERPRQKEHGDWATNVALVLASKAKRRPRDVAEAIAARLPKDAVIRHVEVAGPGFINLFLGPSWLHDVLRDVLTRGDGYGRRARRGERVQVEYVSANPTGPLHVGTARNAALGDSLANVLDAAGWHVEREYYFNDAGTQLELFADSVAARYLARFGVQQDIPEGGYHGDYVDDVAEAVAAHVGDSLVQADPEERRRVALELGIAHVMDWIRRTLDRFGVHIDTWASQGELWRSGAIDRAVERLRDDGYAYDSEGAVFFRSTAFGDEKDRVLIRSNGEPTYFAADCAYVLDKAGRGFDRLIYVWGADHHGTVKRLLAAAKALGVEVPVDILIYQLVSLYRGGEPLRMSKRAGDYVTLDELLDEVGADAARYTLLTRSPDSPLDFDIEVVTRQTMDNPVYYVQYAHARIASLLRVAHDEGVELRDVADVDLGRLREEAELDVIRVLDELPEVIEQAAEAMAPHRLTRYAEEVAAAFHRFYTDWRVITDDPELTQARLALARATKQVLATALGLIGVSAPESMQRLDQDA